MEDSSDPRMCVMHDPPDPERPEDEFLLYWRKLQFARLKLARAVDEFDHVNTILANTSPDDEEAELRKLKRLQEKVTERKRFVAQAEAALANTRKGRWEVQARKSQEETARRIEQFNSRRRGIRI